MKHAWPNTLSQSMIAHWRSMLGSIGLALAIGLSVMLLLLRPAHATSGAVTNCTNDTELTQLLGGGGSITFNCNNVNHPATIVLSTQKVITQPTSIDGGEVITLSGGGVTRIFSVPVGSQLTLANISLINGAPSNGHGGAILNAGQLIASNVLFYNNVATGTVWVGGGAIRATGALTLTDSRFVSNTAKGVGGAIWIDDTSGLVPVFISATTFYSNTSLDWGGALDNDGGNPLIVINSVFHDNRSLTAGAGALDSDSLGPLQINGSSFYHNVGQQDCCGAIYDNGPITVTNSSIYGNWSRDGAGGILAGRPAVFINVAIYSNTTIGNGGGLFAYSNTTLSNVQIYSNFAAQGGGIYNSQYLSSVLHLNQVSIYSNRAITTGGGLYVNNLALIQNSDLYSNTAAREGGAIYLSGTLSMVSSAIYSNTANIAGGLDAMSGSATLINDTIAHNNAVNVGGVRSSTALMITNSTIYNNIASISGNISGTVQIINTIIGGGVPNNCGKPITSLGHNLESGNSCGLSAIGDITNRNPLLFPLANYGGPTWSMLPMPGSPAINHGSNAVCPPTDQRGITRPNGGVCDIGAVEFNLAHSIYLPLVLKNF